jgi:hypothetical protein
MKKTLNFKPPFRRNNYLGNSIKKSNRIVEKSTIDEIKIIVECDIRKILAGEKK